MVPPMHWFGRKLDFLAAALLAAVIGMALSQALAFSQQYLQRLGGHRDEAERALLRIEEVVSGGTAVDISRRKLAADARANYDGLANDYNAIREASSWSRPIVVIGRLDSDISQRVLEDFQPALPIDGASLTYGAGGMLLAVVAYDMIKWPFAALGRVFRRRNRRGFPSGPAGRRL